MAHTLAPAGSRGSDDDWLIEHVAADAEYRSRGLIQDLIAEALRKGREAGFKRATITFLIGNQPAENCYTKSGFFFAEEKRNENFEKLTGAAGFRRFERAI